MRSLRMATWTRLEPASVSCVRYFSTVGVLSKAIGSSDLMIRRRAAACAGNCRVAMNRNRLLSASKGETYEPSWSGWESRIAKQYRVRPTLRSRPEQSADPAEHLLEACPGVVVHHDHEQERDREQAEPENVFPGSHAEWASLRRLQHVDHDLAAVENRNRQQIEYGDVDAQQGDQVEQHIDSALRRTHGGARDRDGPTELLDRLSA